MVAQQLLNEWVVVIDPTRRKGSRHHGAKAKEKDINLAVALKTGKYINEYLKDVKVIYTRDDDTFPELDERAEVANRHKADISFRYIQTGGPINGWLARNVFWDRLWTKQTSVLP
jgi:N-acetylmuramoyl-L-alanine amidase